MLKRVTAALTAAIIICLSLCSCGMGSSSALAVAGAEISPEIFKYYLDRVEACPADFGLAADAARDEVVDEAVSLCVHYVAANTLFRNNGLHLTAAEKTEIAQTVDNLWIRYENHYGSIGVSRATLTKIKTADACEDRLFTYVYDKGTDAREESEILTYYYINYTAFRAVCSYFVDEQGAELSSVKRGELVASFEGLIDSYAASADFAAAAAELGLVASGTCLLKNGDDGYPEGFFKSVSSLGDNSAAVLEYDDCVFAVQKESIEEKGEELYYQYRSECMRELYGEDFSELFAEEEAKYNVERNNAVINKAANAICEITTAQS